MRACCAVRAVRAVREACGACCGGVCGEESERVRLNVTHERVLGRLDGLRVRCSVPADESFMGQLSTLLLLHSLLLVFVPVFLGA
jgi:hypothetical protein